MAGPKKNISRREREKPAGAPSSSSAYSTASVQSSSAQSTASSAMQSVKTSSSGAKTVISAQFDGPKDSIAAPAAGSVSIARNLEGLGMMTWGGHLGTTSTIPLPKRNGKFSTVGREVNVGLNTFDVKLFPQKPVQQYDVTIVNDKGAPTRMVMMKVWNSIAMKQAIKSEQWIFDGNKLAWSMSQLKRTDVTVDLSAEEGKRPSPKNTFRVRIDPAKVVSFTHLNAYISGKTDFDAADLEAISFVDHLMRQYPSQRYTQIKKSFFARGQQRFPLGNGIEAFKGVYASCRPVLTATRQPGFSVNVDVANGTFFSQMDLIDSVMQICRCRSPEDLQSMFLRDKKDWRKSNMYKFLKAYTHVGVSKKYMPDGPNNQVKIHNFVNKDAYEHTFSEDKYDDKGNVVSSTTTTLADYVLRKYNLRLKKNMPLAELTKKVKGKPEYIPLEGLALLPNQRYKLKLDDKQTSQMIKFAVTLPKERWAAVEHGLKMLEWENDPYLKAYGMQISKQPTSVKGRILPCPEPTFANGKVDAKQASQGRWRIDGKKFHVPNTNRPLRAWGFMIVDGGRGPCVNQKQAEHFADRFVSVARAHGMAVAGPPHVMPVKAVRGGEMISDAWNATGNKFQTKPNMLFFIVPDKNTELYRRIKKSCECRYGVVSQVLQSQHVVKAQDQYISNVCMKVNAKLGGATCVARGGLNKLNPNWGKAPTMIIGADVSHAAPGDDTSGSMAAFTMSMDKEFTRYAAQCETNGNRVEIISTNVINTKLHAMVEMWAKNFGGHIPQQVIYFRDGVSEGQFQFVLNQEVADMKLMMKKINPKVDPKFTVVICGKRHHVRFFPGGAGDRNQNPHPGTLVESGVTHPFEVDYYLASHSAIKGTARPVHYNVIANENNYSIEFIEQLSFEHCMQYARSTTPVSMVPPVYYAHLASNRCIAHVNKPAVSSGKKDANEKKKETTAQSSSDKTGAEIPPLMPLNNSLNILGSMWYI